MQLRRYDYIIQTLRIYQNFVFFKMLHKCNHFSRSFSFHYAPLLLLRYPVIKPITVYSA